MERRRACIYEKLYVKRFSAGNPTEEPSYLGWHF